MVTAHYFFDPMCGWCYGATPLAETLASASNVNMILHAGGMITRQKMHRDFRAMAQEFDKKIASQTGQIFSVDYHNRLTSNNTIMLDSYITAQGVYVMEKFCSKGFDMLKAIQQAHYQFALDVSDYNVLATIASKLGVEESRWSRLMRSQTKQIDDDIHQEQQLMNLWGVRGFPTFIIEKDGNLTSLPHENYYKDLVKWKELVEQL
ncbi:DsbA family protein [Colwellia echini]|uniref:DsbA family protein n=1 Tax=Colwellia echini TaxID=1982103 RepID=A0ABY3MYD6_9GAMM|nr:DsbA family protein [Colwellia echini]TYK66240.1 DsbA family protein [Colwellia echini]